MSKCVINVKVGEESIPIEVDSSKLPSNLSEFRNLFNQEQWSKIVDIIETTLKNRKIVESPNLRDILKSSHIIPNTTIGALKNRFPDISFPEDVPGFDVSNMKVLFVSSYRTVKGELKYGLFKNPNGENVFIIDQYHISQVAAYLTTMKAIESENVLSRISPDVEEDLSKIIKVVEKKYPEIKSTKDLLVNFLQNKNKYSKLVFTDSNKNTISIYAYLSGLVSDIFGISSRRAYTDPTINNINQSLAWNKTFTRASISLELLYKFIPNDLRDTIKKVVGEKNQLSFEKFKEYFGDKKITKAQLETIFKGVRGNSPYEILVNSLLSREPEFAMLFDTIEKDRVYFKSYFPTLETQFGIGFDELLKYEEPYYYNGRYILKKEISDGVFEYYVTRHYTTPIQRAVRFNTLSEAQTYIVNNENEIIPKNSLIEFHKKEQDDKGKLILNENPVIEIETPQEYEVGTLITLLDYDVPNIPFDRLTPLEQILTSKYGKSTIDDFYEYLDKELSINEEQGSFNNIVSKINTPEKIALFVLSVNEAKSKIKSKKKLNDDKWIIKIADDIDKVNEDPTKRRYYYVEKSNGRKTVLIRVKSGGITEYRKSPKTPVIQLWNAASKVMKSKLGIDVELVLPENMEKGKEDKKAYIKGDKIFINVQNARSQDLFHEYVHVIMAYLKNGKYREQYLNLLQLVWDKGNKLRRHQIINAYSDYSMEDKMEEFFVDQFGAWINRNANESLSNIFTEDPSLREAKNIFSDKKTMQELFGSTIEQVFTIINSDIAIFLKRNKPLMENEFPKFKISRQKTEWIRQQIHDKKIEEDCGK